MPANGPACRPLSPQRVRRVRLRAPPPLPWTEMNARRALARRVGDAVEAPLDKGAAAGAAAFERGRRGPVRVCMGASLPPG